MNIYELVAALSEEEQQRAATTETMPTDMSHPYYWRVYMYAEDTWFEVDILHRYGDVKDAKCSYCKTSTTTTGNCIHIPIAYVAIAKQLAEPVDYNLYDDLNSFSKEELVHMLALLQRQSEQLLQPFLQPNMYPKVEAYAIIDATLNQVEGKIDEENEEIVFSGFDQVWRNATWLYKRNPILAIRHQLACFERLCDIEERCDEDIYELMYSLTDLGIDRSLKNITKKSLAAAATDELLRSIQLIQQPCAIEALFYNAIQISHLSERREAIEAALNEHRGKTLSEEQYGELLYHLKRYVLTKEERLTSYAEQHMAFARLRELLAQAEKYGDMEEGLALCDRLDYYNNYPTARDIQAAYREKFSQQ